MNLDIKKWKDFKVSSIFTIHNGKGITKEEIEENTGDFTVVQSGEENNGVLGKIDRNYCEAMNYTLTDKPCLTVARSGSAGFVSFQVDGCVVGDSAKILLLDEEIASNEVYAFLQTILSANRFKYAYGRKVTESKYMNDTIKLPIERNEDGTPFTDNSKKYSEDGYVPDWEWMENYIKSLKYKPFTTKNKFSNIPNLNVNEWKDFIFSSLFDVSGTTTTPKEELEYIGKGKYPYVTTSATNNGVEGFYSHFTEEGNVIVIESACAGFATYQSENFSASDHAEKCTPLFDMNINIGIFLVTIINADMYKYSYGRKCNQIRIKNRTIKLPIQHNKDGSPFIDSEKKYSPNGYVPDWNFMENYIKSLPYGDRI